MRDIPVPIHLCYISVVDSAELKLRRKQEVTVTVQQRHPTQNFQRTQYALPFGYLNIAISSFIPSEHHRDTYALSFTVTTLRNVSQNSQASKLTFEQFNLVVTLQNSIREVLVSHLGSDIGCGNKPQVVCSVLSRKYLVQANDHFLPNHFKLIFYHPTPILASSLKEYVGK